MASGATRFRFHLRAATEFGFSDFVLGFMRFDSTWSMPGQSSAFGAVVVALLSSLPVEAALSHSDPSDLTP
jgi:hypothetical protein